MERRKEVKERSMQKRERRKEQKQRSKEIRKQRCKRCKWKGGE
jgi:hypothetical protein